MTVVEFEHVEKRFGSTVALHDVGFAIGRGELVALLGPNGTGKSTALALLLGLRRPDAGRARLFGQDPRQTRARKRLGVALQEPVFPGTLRVRELVGLVQAHASEPLRRAELLARFGLDALAQRQVGGLSGGERRRLAVALALACNPSLVVLDEPTAGLDTDARRVVWEAVQDHADRGGTTLFTTHHLDEAEQLATRVLLLDDGRVVGDGSVVEIKAAAGLASVSYRGPDGRRVCRRVADPGAEVARLVRTGAALHDLEVRPLTLEEALTARRRR
ncbi:MAG: ABC transporter ATP-binding protein [Actinobacteria bacterium]|nr:ABC transporter ATP-binding protein [Actinomycetota bacterium]